MSRFAQFGEHCLCRVVISTLARGEYFRAILGFIFRTTEGFGMPSFILGSAESLLVLEGIELIHSYAGQGCEGRRI
jgi:hypothetical protein